MKEVVFIANRLNVLKVLHEYPDLHLKRLYVLEDSLLDKNLDSVELDGTDVKRFDNKYKAQLIQEIKEMDFDILLSNGCPFILPVSEMIKPSQMYINVHPTLLPNLKGKTPLNGIFLTHQKYLGATMHYMDNGIDTGKIIAQSKAEVTDDLDQGLVYKMSFDNETLAFKAGMKKLKEYDYKFEGLTQEGEGSYFNRTEELQTINIDLDNTNLIIDKIKSFGFKGQGSYLKLDGKDYVVYAAEKIINKYLLKEYEALKPGEIAFRYEDKCILKTKDGLIKVYDYVENSLESR